MPKGIKEKEDFTDRDAAFIEKWSDANFDQTKKTACAVSAGLGAGDMARLNGGRVSKALVQNKKLRSALKRKGVDMDKIADKIVQLLDAKSQYNEHLPDNFIQHKTLETAIRVLDANPPQKIEVDKTTTTHVVITQDAIQRIEKYKKMRELTQDANTGVYSE